MKIFQCHRFKRVKKLIYLLTTLKKNLVLSFVKEETFPESRLIDQFIEANLCSKTLKTKRYILTGQGTNMKSGIAV